MIYYAVIYMKNGEIHLKPYGSREEAELHCKEIYNTKWADKVDITRVVKKDPEKSWFKQVKGYWI